MESKTRCTPDDMVEASYEGKPGFEINGHKITRPWFYTRTQKEAWIGGGTCITFLAAECLADVMNEAPPFSAPLPTVRASSGRTAELDPELDGVTEYAVAYTEAFTTEPKIEPVAGPQEAAARVAEWLAAGVDAHQVTRVVTVWAR